MTRTRVGDLLLEADLISPYQLSQALEYQQTRGGRTVGILIELGALGHDDLYHFLATRGMPAINPLHCAVAQQVLDLLPRDFVAHHEIFPVDRLGRLLTVAMVYPFDTVAITEAERITGLRVKPVLCRGREFREALHRYYPDNYTFASSVHCGKAESSETLSPPEKSAKDTLARIRELTNLPVTRHTKSRFGLLDGVGRLNAERAAAVLSRDPIALARVLSAANAREWSRRRAIVDRHEAIRVLGLRGVVEALELPSTWEEHLRPVETTLVRWRETAVAVAETAAELAKTYGVSGAAGVYEAALLHNLGAIAFLVMDRVQYPAIFAMDPAYRRERERSAYGIDHTLAGAELANAWGLPASIQTTVRHLYTPESATSAQDIVAIAAIAHHIYHTERSFESHCGEAMRILGISPSSLRGTLLHIRARGNACADEQ